MPSMSFVKLDKHMVYYGTCTYKMAASVDTWDRLKETRLRLQKCWEVHLDWSLFPDSLKQVRTLFWLPYSLMVDRAIIRNTVITAAV